ncbi:hypothetical protein WICPIJ_004475 [Wickerhamomyces pijperi]|uniref:Uncharacterized protein n=1 Tax=Wickerhamomyces pijperi TaxID=599730 RepID=A0A9P8Q7N0_WICPI|nr:hypothetical protein WICPIJ_004475 [Wickerhamomyces pijperi]
MEVVKSAAEAAVAAELSEPGSSIASPVTTEPLEPAVAVPSIKIDKAVVTGTGRVAMEVVVVEVCSPIDTDGGKVDTIVVVNVAADVKTSVVTNVTVVGEAVSMTSGVTVNVIVVPAFTIVVVLNMVVGVPFVVVVKVTTALEMVVAGEVTVTTIGGSTRVEKDVPILVTSEV